MVISVFNNDTVIIIVILLNNIEQALSADACPTNLIHLNHVLASIFRRSTAALIHMSQKRMHIQCMDTNDVNSAKTEPFSGEPAITSTPFFVLLFYYTKYTIQKQAIPLHFRPFPFKNRCIRQLLFVSTTWMPDWLLILPTTGIRFSGDQ